MCSIWMAKKSPVARSVAIDGIGFMKDLSSRWRLARIVLWRWCGGWGLAITLQLRRFPWPPGFLLMGEAPDTELISTGMAPWEVTGVPGITSRWDKTNVNAALAGCNFAWDASQLPPDMRLGDGPIYKPAKVGTLARERVGTDQYGDVEGRMMHAGSLPQLLRGPVPPGRVRHVDDAAFCAEPSTRVKREDHRASEAGGWDALLRGAASLKLPPKSQRRVVIDLEDYFCAYTELETVGGEGGLIRISWAESLFEKLDDDGEKGNRDDIEGKAFLGRTDEFLPHGKTVHRFEPLWWNCGRYLQICVVTGVAPLEIQRLAFSETRYPIERDGPVPFPGVRRWDKIEPILWRTLQMCMHETYMDCPYYEQLQYAGDTRVQMLITYVYSDDDRLARKCIRLFADSILPMGLTQSRYPSSNGQVIPQFSLFWVAMLHDHAVWRGDFDWLRQFMPGARRVMEVYLAGIRPDGTLETPPGWNWVDWSHVWWQKSMGPFRGHSPLDADGWSGINALHFVYIAGLAAELETWVGEAAFAERLLRARVQVMEAARRTFWDTGRNCFADNRSRTYFSEHAQAYALLTGLLSDAETTALHQALREPEDLAPATLYFLHYVFEALLKLRDREEVLRRMDVWQELVDKGFRTAIERPDPSRSDCHAWGSHPIFHAATGFGERRPPFVLGPQPMGT